MAAPGGREWSESRAEKEAKRDLVKIGERIGNLIGVIILILEFYFFATPSDLLATIPTELCVSFDLHSACRALSSANGHQGYYQSNSRE